jgi:hypothetical protein
METYVIEQDIPVLYVAAEVFPEGIKAAHEQLHALFPPSAERNFYGISRPENGAIVYKAAAEELHPGEAQELGCERMHVKKGNYISILVNRADCSVEKFYRPMRIFSCGLALIAQTRIIAALLQF